MDKFPLGVGEKIQFYVYRLIDPRNGETFYVGKGKGDRLFQHVNARHATDVTEIVASDDDAEGNSEDEVSLKVKRLNDIHRAGLDVVHIVHRHGIPDAKTAYEVEAALIDAYAGLSNISAGHYSNDRGPMHAQEIADKYSLPEADLGDYRLILININSAEHTSDEELLDRVRYAWRLSEQRARSAEYVLAVIHGVVRGAFVPEEWLPATPEHFPPRRFSEPTSKRIGFIGHKANDEIWEYFVGSRGKRLPEDKRHGQNPIRYHNC
ncbi:hypothetical protein AXZ77_2422 [Thioclava sp. ES.031]|uniref:LEM-3-like GIY-YIG domain-containing protein n=1 Tax=Thioclava sp. ES.031 TaxID=1798203 RepID=UPI000BF8E770|nr:hypothetical protein [Thioclava sp. ES.031]PFG63802.1 hypothetical protein AXZ77_2422 [Thioclava sp. ES.031]